MSTSTHDLHERTVQLAEMAAAAAGFQYGLAALLAHAAESARSAEERDGRTAEPGGRHDR